MEKIHLDLFTIIGSLHGRLPSKFIHLHQNVLFSQRGRPSRPSLRLAGTTVLFLGFYSDSLVVPRQRVGFHQSIFPESHPLVRTNDRSSERKGLIFSLFSSDFQIREANALPIAHTYTVMCVLPINLFNQVNTFSYDWRAVVSICRCICSSKYLLFFGFGLSLSFC